MVPWDADRSWKGIGFIWSLSTEKLSKMCQNIRILVWFDNCWKLLIFWYVLDVYLVLSDRIILIPFHEQSASYGTSLEYHQQGNQSNLKIHFFRLRGVLGGTLGKKIRETKLCFGYPDQMRYLRNKFETKVGEWALGYMPIPYQVLSQFNWVPWAWMFSRWCTWE